jgi:hypothetical protein
VNSVQALLGLWRRHGPQLLASVADPHAELLTLMWGPQFDHLYARQRLAPSVAGPEVDPPTRFVLWQAGLLFDQLPSAAQQRLRRLILRHRSLSPTAHPWGTMPHGPHPAH